MIYDRIFSIWYMYIICFSKWIKSFRDKHPSIKNHTKDQVWASNIKYLVSKEQGTPCGRSGAQSTELGARGPKTTIVRCLKNPRIFV